MLEFVVPRKELKERWNRAGKILDAYNFDCLIVPFGVNFQYFFGKCDTLSERLTLAIVSRDGNIFILAPKFEHSNFSKKFAHDDIVVWDETESPHKLLLNELTARGINGTICVDPKFWFSEVEKLKQLGSWQKFYSGDSLFESLRRQKSNWEIKQLKIAAKASAEGIMAGFARLSEGITERESLLIFSEELSVRSGNPLSFGIIQFGSNSALPHGAPTSKKLKTGDVVLLDIGTSVNGYHGDITITLPFGKAPQLFYEIYDIVFEANRLAFRANKKGAIPSDLDKIARDYISSKGFGKYFTHRLGHGIGLEVHEHPYIVASNLNPLDLNDTHTIEPGVYIPDKFGVRIEDDVIVNEDGCSFLFEALRYSWT